MGPFSLFKLILIIVASTQTGSVSVTTFPALVETGKTALYEGSIGFFGFPGNACANGQTTLSIPFTSDKGTDSFDSAFAFEALNLLTHYRALSIRTVLAGKTSSSIMVLIEAPCASTLRQLYVRFLVVVPPLVGPVSLRYLRQDYNPAVLLNQGSNFRTLSTSISLQANETKTALFLMGFAIQNRASSNFLDLYCSQTITNTNLEVRVTTVGNNHAIYLSHISLTVVMVKTRFTLNGSLGTFEVNSLLNNYQTSSSQITHSNVNTAYDNRTTFFGIRAFKNRDINSALVFSFVLSSTEIRFLSNPVLLFWNKFAVDIINFVFLPSCTGASPYLLASNRTCYSSCPASFFANTNEFTCENCSSSCLACELTASNCTSCHASLYLANGTCLPCPDACLLCHDQNNCLSCASGQYVLSARICVLNCSSLPQCTFCQLESDQPLCVNCSANYTIAEGRCVGICGDGVLVTGELCDDGNPESNDGCSSSCTEEQYFTCSSVSGEKSICSLNEVSLEYGYTVKVRGSNAFASYFTVRPNIPEMVRIGWMGGLSFENQHIHPSSCVYDPSVGKLIVTASYSADIGSAPVIFSVNYESMGNVAVEKLPNRTFTQSLATENNLSLRYYPDSIYGLAAFIQYYSIMLSCVGLLMLVVGYFGGKLIVLEHIAVLQVAYLCLQTVHDASPTFQALRPLRFCAGNTMFTENDYSANISKELKGSYYSFNLFDSYNVAFALVLLPILVALIIKAVSITVLKSNQVLSRVWPHILGEMTFYGLIFTSYLIFSQFCFALLTITSGVITVYMGLSIAFCQSLLLFIYCYYLNESPLYFGDFKKKFQKFNICSYFYTFVVLQRFLTSIFIIFLRNTSFGLAVAALPIVVQLIFVAVRQPYVCGDDTRPIINLSFAILIIFSVLASNLLSSVNLVQICVPLAVCTMLTVTLVSSICYLIVQLKSIYWSANRGKGELAGLGESGITIDKIFKFQQPESIEEKNRAQFEIFKQRIMSDSEDMSLNFNAINVKAVACEEETLQKEMLHYEWENYAVVSTNMPILHQMRSKVKAKRILPVQIVQQLAK